MSVKQAYDIWAAQYDTNENKTRDLEAIALRSVLADIHVARCLEIGCGTGKNTEWLVTKADMVTSVDLSEEMLARAKEKISSEKVEFVQADIMRDWTFAKGTYDLVTFSLVLEHIEDLNSIFQRLSAVIRQNGLVYIGELHPFKQYAGSKARFETGEGLQVVTCFTHHISDFTQAALKNGFEIGNVNEAFDDNDRAGIPRIFILVLRKK